MALPRRLELRTVGGRVRLVQRPAAGIERIVDPTTLRWTDVDLAGERPLPAGADRTALDIRARIDVGTADDVGLTVFADANHRTVIGYDAVTGRLYVDRTTGGSEPVGHGFPGRHEAPLVTTDGILDLRIVLDKTSVEVFGGDGEAVITDQVFPPPGADGSSVFAHGGTARLLSLEVRPLEPS
jgi:sucrose-6-phosphate hydrolase SacC (GH32 family)